MKKIYDDDDSPKWKRVFGVDKRERSINRDVIVQYLLRIFIPYQFTCYLQIFLPHIPLLCLHISLSTPINPSSTDFITLVRDVPSSIGPHTHTLSLSFCISIFLSIMSYTRVVYRFSLLHGPPFVPAFIEPRNLQHPRYTSSTQLSKAAVFIHRRGFHPLPPGNNGSRSITGRTSSFRKRS